MSIYCFVNPHTPASHTRAGVSTDIVGKYSYFLDMPIENRRVPVIVDVALIGRTKIIKLHSALWVHVSACVNS